MFDSLEKQGSLLFSLILGPRINNGHRQNCFERHLSSYDVTHNSNFFVSIFASFKIISPIYVDYQAIRKFILFPFVTEYLYIFKQVLGMCVE